MKFFEVFLSGGIFMWVILLCLIIVLIIITQKILEQKKSKNSIGAFSIKIRVLLKKKDVNGAASYCMEEKTPIANIIRRGLKKYKHGRKRVIEAAESAARIEIKKMEKGLTILATIASGAPLLGFLGALVDLIFTFIKIQETNGSAQISDLAGGIWPALLVSAFGILTGIIAMASYNYFVSSISKNVQELEMMAVDIMDVMDSNDSDFSESQSDNEDE